ncbi:hypothetical protein HerbRD11066_68190 [Herbidospora sp. RD11066]
MLGDERQHLLDECGHVERRRLRRLVPALEQQFDGRDRLHEAGAEFVVGWMPGVVSRSLTYTRNTAGPPWRPERPRRWRRAATPGGAPSWATEVTEPMSTPISRVEVQIAVTGRDRSLSRDSTCSRRSFDRLP